MDKALMRRNRLRILVAEDEPLAAMVLDEALTELGHTVVLASNGEEALHLAEAVSFDVLVTDLAMPRMTGWELIPRLRACCPGMPVVVMTGFLPPGGRSMLLANQGGRLTVLLKPFELSQLTAAIDQVTSRVSPPPPPGALSALLELH